MLPNAWGPVLVIAPSSRPGRHRRGLALLSRRRHAGHAASLGTLIRIGKAFLFSGEWWIVIFPALALVILSLAVNLLGDWLRDALNPKLR